MKKLLIITVIIVIFIFSINGQSNNLLKEYSITTGDMIAFKLNDFFRINIEKYSAPTMVSYNKKMNKIEIKIYGSRANVEGAKSSLIEWWEFISEKLIPLIYKEYDIELKKKDFIIIYIDRKWDTGPKEILRMESEKIIIPE